MNGEFWGISYIMRRARNMRQHKFASEEQVCGRVDTGRFGAVDARFALAPECYRLRKFLTSMAT